jgi:hypothetical protein
MIQAATVVWSTTIVSRLLRVHVVVR